MALYTKETNHAEKAFQYERGVVLSRPMARASFLMPTVFVGCPYSGKFKFDSFRKTLSRLPFSWYYADTHLNSKHLLSILTTYINAVDYCIFDVSLWNPNVSLELGLAEGLGKDYYILVNKNQSADVPSDIKGIQRIEYSSIDSLDASGLIPNIVRYLVKEHTHPKRIWDNLSGINREKKYYLALAILAHFRENKRLAQDDLAGLSQGSYLRKEVQNEVLDLLKDLKYLTSVGTRRGAVLSKRIFPRALRFR